MCISKFLTDLCTIKQKIPFKIYTDFECIFKKVECDSIKNDSSYTEKYQSHILCSFSYKVVCIDNKFSKKVVLYRGKKCCLQIC